MIGKPWDRGVEHAKSATILPTPHELKRRFGLTYRQAALFLFGFREARGYRYPPNFRAKAEWLLREKLDANFDMLVLAIDAMPNAEPDPFSKIAEYGLAVFREPETWEESFTRRHGARPHSQLQHRNMPPLP